MLQKTLIPAVAALILSIGGPAFAQPYGYGPGDHGRPSERDYRGPQRDARHDARDDRRDDRRDAVRSARFHRGDRLPANYRNRHYVVNDWRGHHLRQPPRGQQWVQIGAEYALVAIATGIILDLAIHR